ANYKPWTNSKLNLSAIKNHSQERINKNKSFNLIKESAERLKKQSDNTVRSLALQKYLAEEKRSEAEAKRYEEAKKEVPVLTVKRLQEDLQALGTDTAKVARNTEFLKSLKQDIYLEEAVEIITSDI